MIKKINHSMGMGWLIFKRNRKQTKAIKICRNFM